MVGPSLIALTPALAFTVGIPWWLIPVAIA
jgi:hypothetical protein